MNRHSTAVILSVICLLCILAACSSVHPTPAQMSGQSSPALSPTETQQICTITPTPSSTPGLSSMATQQTESDFCSFDPGIYDQVEWAVPVAPARTQRLYGFDWAGYFRQSYLFWNEDNTISLKTDCGEAVIQMDPSSGDAISRATFTPTPTSMSGDGVPTQVYSPRGTYFIQCETDGSKMYRAEDQKLLGITSENMCGYADTGAWAEDESGYAIIQEPTSDPGLPNTVLWLVNEKAPMHLGYAYLVRWSPDSKRLLALNEYYDPNRPEKDLINRITIFDTTGQRLSYFEFTGQPVGMDIHWYTNEIIDINIDDLMPGNYHKYYEWASGKFVGNSYDDFDPPLSFQNVSLSPDRHWQVNDLSPWENLGQEDHTYHYTLSDFRGRQVTDLISGPDQQIQFLDWSPDSKTFYLVSRPASEKAVVNSKVPLGLVALSVGSKYNTSLLAKAMYAQLSPDQKRAWVIYPTERTDGSMGMDGAFFDMKTRTLTEAQPVAQMVRYQDPADGDWLASSWSHDGTQLVYMTDQREVTWIDIDGQKKVLGTLPESVPVDDRSLPADWYRLSWSPNDRWLVVQSVTWFWVLDLGGLHG